jgi:hypothetical protein
MNRDVFSTGEAEFLSFASVFHTGTNANATPEILMDFGLQPKARIRTDVPDPAEVVPFTLESGEYLHVTVKHPARIPTACIQAGTGKQTAQPA